MSFTCIFNSQWNERDEFYQWAFQGSWFIIIEIFCDELWHLIWKFLAFLVKNLFIYLNHQLNSNFELHSSFFRINHWPFSSTFRELKNWNFQLNYFSLWHCLEASGSFYSTRYLIFMIFLMIFTFWSIYRRRWFLVAC
jgi:hypothetical protein